jgi:hypothetical protein
MLTPQPPLDMAFDNVGWVLAQVGGPATCAVACVVVKLVAEARPTSPSMSVDVAGSGPA